MPYWSDDIGGFFRPNDQYSSQDYHDLLVRWFQFGAFTPIYRVHGGGSNTEICNYADDVLKILNNTHNLRYRLLPYTYSGFYRVETEGYTMQRGLAFDFAATADAGSNAHAAEDANVVVNIADEFMWGDSLLIAPITNAHDSMNGSRSVYLPAGPGETALFWYDFFTGAEPFVGGSTIIADAPIEHTPMHVKCGSVVVMGALAQSTVDPSATNGPLEIRVYKGADAKFTLFEDDGLSQKYQAGIAGKGMATVAFDYSEADATLTIGARKGSFAGMAATRSMLVVFVRAGHGAGLMPTPDADADHIVEYTGAEVKVKYTPPY
jgi:alpha-D-xyloside xylohydrolase